MTRSCRRRFSSMLMLMLMLPLAACASGVAAPSLAPRPIEARGVFAEPAAGAAAVAKDAAFDARVAAALAPAVDGEGRFAAARETAARLAAAAAKAAPGSESWVAAQQALTALDAARGPAQAALGDLDALRIEAAGRTTALDATALGAAFARAAAIERTQRDAYDAVARGVPG